MATIPNESRESPKEASISKNRVQSGLFLGCSRDPLLEGNLFEALLAFTASAIPQMIKPIATK
jgi:hypothetical protein